MASLFSNNNLYNLNIITLALNVNNHLLLNLLLSIISNTCIWHNPRSMILLPLLHATSSMISGLMYNYRFKNSFKSGELVLLSQLTAKLVVYCHENRCKGWAPFFLLINSFPLLFRFKNFNLVPAATWIVFSAAFTLKRQLFIDLIIGILEDKRLLVYWPSLLTLILSLPVLFPKSPLFSNQNSLRKFYHFSAVALFVPAAFWSLNVLKIALAFASSLFIYIETIRTDLKTCKNHSFEKFNEFMERCRNELDSGEMILSHFYLLLGCSLPFWLNPNSMNISSFSGVISLGIGDSLASIGGKRFGRTTWHSKTRKTLEGSFFGCIGMFLAWIILNELCSAYDKKISIEKLFFISVASSVWEALIDLNDNLTLPLFTHFIINRL